jgi:hypothetical protein
MMKAAIALLLAASLSGVLMGCKKGASSGKDLNAEIRTAIQAHLAHKGNLNLQAFDMNVQTVTVQGDHAQAQVAYNVKNGPGVMQLTYALEKRDGSWAVIESNPVGSNFSHPSLDGTQNPAASGGKDNLGNSISDMVRGLKSNGSGAGGTQNLPPGHPPVNNAPANGPK